MRPLIPSIVATCALAVLGLLTAAPAAAQGAVTPSFGGGTLVLEGGGYRPGERVEISVRAAGQTQQFTATADAQGEFLLQTGLAVPPFSSLEIEARDEQGITQATITSAPGSPAGPAAGAPLPPGPVPPPSDPGEECPARAGAHR